MKLKYFLIGGAALIALPVVGGLYSTFSSVVTAPSRVINKTLQTDNIINNYEWFHDAYGQYMQWNGKYLYSDKPFRTTVEPLVVSIQ